MKTSQNSSKKAATNKLCDPATAQQIKLLPENKESRFRELLKTEAHFYNQLDKKDIVDKYRQLRVALRDIMFFLSKYELGARESLAYLTSKN